MATPSVRTVGCTPGARNCIRSTRRSCARSVVGTEKVTFAQRVPPLTPCLRVIEPSPTKAPIADAHFANRLVTGELLSEHRTEAEFASRVVIGKHLLAGRQLLNRLDARRCRHRRALGEAAEVSVDPFHRRALVCQRALGD